ILECVETRIALSVYLDSAPTPERGTKYRAMFCKRLGIARFAQLVEPPGRLFDVGEEERHRARRKLASGHGVCISAGHAAPRRRISHGVRGVWRRQGARPPSTLVRGVVVQPVERDPIP